MRLLSFIITFLLFLKLTYLYSFSEDPLEAFINNSFFKRLLTIAQVYNPQIKMYDFLELEKKTQAQSYLYDKEYMIGPTVTIDTKNFFPSLDPSSKYSIMYSIKSPLNNKEKYEFYLAEAKLIYAEKRNLLNEIAQDIKIKLINHYFLNKKLEEYSNITKLWAKIMELAKTNYKYSKTKLSEIYALNSFLYNLELEKISIKNQITTNQTELYNLINYQITLPLSLTNQELRYSDLESIYLESLAKVDLYNNPQLMIIQSKIELTQEEIKKENSERANLFSIEYMTRPSMPSMIYFSYQIILPNKNKQKLLSKSLEQRIKSLEEQKKSIYKDLYYKYQTLHYQIQLYLEELKTYNAVSKNLEKQLKHLELEYTYNQSPLINVYYTLRDIKETRIKIIDTLQAIYINLIEIDRIRGRLTK